MAGKVWLVGAGPGDPELLTLKGSRVLRDADVVVYDRLIGDGVLCHAKPDAELIDVGKRGGCHPVPQEEIEKILVAKTREGKKVVRLKGGDPFLFGRGGEEMAALMERDITCEVVPGVTSATAVPACAGIPVTLRGCSSSLHVVTAHRREDAPAAEINYEALVRLEGTLVFLMGASKLKEICDCLIAAGMNGETPAAVIENGATPRQRQVFGNLTNLPGRAEANNIQAPVVIVVGRVVVALTQEGTPPPLPLAGKRVLVPRVTRKNGDKSGRLAAVLRSRGAEVVEIPVSRAEAITAPLPSLAGYEWLVFTSAAGVEVFFTRLGAECRDVREIGEAKIAAVGPATQEALQIRGLRVELVPAAYNGAALGEALSAVARGCLLLLRAENGAPDLPEALRAKGLDFREVPLYRTVPVPCRVDAGDFDAVAFTCASSVRNFTYFRPNVNIKAACIGEKTAQAAREAGYTAYTAENAALEALADAVERLSHAKE
ncbi:MAG: uroporphyrinogen-III C-methyltransferase [Synergistaceae bacterium]|nr:uroporphyrinogen-III C-methyltransferase [Synergistaceae bacterium]